MTDDTVRKAHDLVAAVHAAAEVHQSSWEMLVPDQFVVNLDAEMAEEIAYSDMARAKAALRDHICQTYGMTLRELISLALP